MKELFTHDSLYGHKVQNSRKQYKREHQYKIIKEGITDE